MALNYWPRAFAELELVRQSTSSWIQKVKNDNKNNRRQPADSTVLAGTSVGDTAVNVTMVNGVVEDNAMVECPEADSLAVPVSVLAHPAGNRDGPVAAAEADVHKKWHLSDHVPPCTRIERDENAARRSQAL